MCGLAHGSGVEEGDFAEARNAFGFAHCRVVVGEVGEYEKGRIAARMHVGAVVGCCAWCALTSGGLF